MSKLLLPAQINPPRIRKDGSASLSFDTRELTGEEVMLILGHRNTEGWLCFAPNENEIATPEESANLDIATPSQRLRSVLFVFYKKSVEKNSFVGTFEAFYNEHMEKLIEFIKKKLD